MLGVGAVVGAGGAGDSAGVCVVRSIGRGGVGEVGSVVGGADGDDADDDGGVHPSATLRLANLQTWIENFTPRGKHTRRSLIDAIHRRSDRMLFTITRDREERGRPTRNVPPCVVQRLAPTGRSGIALSMRSFCLVVFASVAACASGSPSRQDARPVSPAKRTASAPAVTNVGLFADLPVDKAGPPEPGLLAELGSANWGHQGPVSDACAFGDGTLASVGVDRMLRVWDGTNRRARGAILLEGGADRIACAPDGSKLAVASSLENKVQIRDTKSGASLATIATKLPAITLKFSPSSQELAIVDKQCGTSVITRTTPRVLEVGRSRGLNFGAAAWSADGASLATVCGGQGGGAGVEVFRFAQDAPPEHRHLGVAGSFERATSVAFVGAELVYGAERAIHFVDAKTLEKRREVSFAWPPGKNAFVSPSPAGSRLAVWGASHLELRDASGAKVAEPIAVSPADVTWTSESSLVVRDGSSFRSFDSALAEQSPPRLRSSAVAMAVSHDRNLLAAVDGAGQLVVFDLSAGGQARFVAQEPTTSALQFAANGDLLAMSTNTVSRYAAGGFAKVASAKRDARFVFDAKGSIGTADRRTIFVVEPSGAVTETRRDSDILAISDEGAMLLERATPGTEARVVERESGRVVSRFPLPSLVLGCSFSSDARLVACRGAVESQVFDTNSGALRLTVEGSVLDMAPNDDRVLVATPYDDCVVSLAGAKGACQKRGTARLVNWNGQPAAATSRMSGAIGVWSVR